jgi:ATP-dependent RNA helicase DeaD
MNSPREVLIESEDLNVKEIEQYYVTTDSRTKSKSLMKLLHREKIDRAILFCRTKRDTFQINEMLRSRGFSSVVINGNLTQNQRDWAMNKFVNGWRRILVATDLAGRGLDIEGITHIINLDVPQDPYNYFHRIGRTGRAGKKGIAITLVSPEQRSNFKKIQEIGGNTIEKAPELVNTRIAR